MPELPQQSTQQQSDIEPPACIPNKANPLLLPWSHCQSHEGAVFSLFCNRKWLQNMKSSCSFETFPKLPMPLAGNNLSYNLLWQPYYLLVCLLPSKISFFLKVIGRKKTLNTFDILPDKGAKGLWSNQLIFIYFRQRKNTTFVESHLS